MLTLRGDRLYHKITNEVGQFILDTLKFDVVLGDIGCPLRNTVIIVCLYGFHVNLKISKFQLQ
jgi:hypothetical protein